MPKIENFKRKNIRAWDDNLLDSLKIKNPDKDSKEVQLDSNTIQDVLPRVSNNERKILTAIVKKMVENESNCTHDMNTQKLTQDVGTTINGLKTGLRRLVQKGILFRDTGKRGVGGVIKFSTTTSIKNKLLNFLSDELSLMNDREEKQNQPPIYNNTITTNKNNNPVDQKTDSTEKDNLIAQIQQQILELQKQQSQLNQPQSVEVKKDQSAKIEDITVTELNEDDWLDLDYSSLTEFGFKKSHVNQIKKFNAKLDADSQLTVDSVQDSIEHYAWALRNKLSEMENYAPSTNRLRGLLGVLKRGGEWVEPNYKSPEDLAYEASLKAKKERLEKIKAQKDELFMLEFEMWRDGLSDEQLAEVEGKGKLKAAMPPSAFKNKGDNTYYVNALKSYYKKNEYKG